jgi:hypothetical protein
VSRNAAVRHVALFRFRAGLSVERQTAFHNAAVVLASSVPGIIAAVAAPNVRLQPDGFDYALMLDFAERGTFTAYKAHPEHLRFIDEQVRPCVEETARVQVELGDVP